jgi:hypothetical protein
VEGGADSLLETLARILFREAGIATQTQVWLDGIGTVDFLLEGFLIVELDGVAFHLEPGSSRRTGGGIMQPSYGGCRSFASSMTTSFTPQRP